MENKPKLGFVYYLQNPITSEIFYVGATKKALKLRLQSHYQHLREALKGDRLMTKKFEYLHNLKSKATIHLLEKVNYDDLYERESFYISHFKEINPNLTNMTDGGIGNYTSKYYTEDQKIGYGTKLSKSLKGLKKPDGFSENLSIQRTGLGNPAAKHIPFGWIVVGESLFKYGFEVNEFVGTKYAYGNVFKHFVKRKRKGNPYGYKWELFSELSIEIQDIVHASYEKKQAR